jgi:hypothetical protein
MWGGNRTHEGVFSMTILIVVGLLWTLVWCALAATFVVYRDRLWLALVCLLAAFGPIPLMTGNVEGSEHHTLLSLPPGWGEAPAADQTPVAPQWCTNCQVPVLEEGAVDLGGGACLDDGVEGIWNVLDCDTPTDFETKTGVSSTAEILPQFDLVPGRTYFSYVRELHAKGRIR